jgi:hypothetical protein
MEDAAFAGARLRQILNFGKSLSAFNCAGNLDPVAPFERLYVVKIRLISGTNSIRRLKRLQAVSK